MVTELQVSSRTTKSKGDIKRMRREGRIPCVLYTGGKMLQSASIAKVDFDTALRGLKKGFLPTTVFSLKNEQGTMQKAIVKDIQYTPSNYDVLHIDFQVLDDKQPVRLKVPVECKNQTECTGVKMGGYLRFVLRHVPVRCLPSEIPSCFELDVKELDIGKALRIRDIEMKKTVMPQVQPNEIVVSVMKSAGA